MFECLIQAIFLGVPFYVRDNWPRTFEIEFGNGEKVNVEYALPDSHLLPRPNRENLDGYIFDLIELANDGNAEAAHDVHRLLNDCANTPRSLSEYNDSLLELQENGLLNYSLGIGVNPGFRFEVGSKPHQSVVDTLKLKFVSCKNVSNQQIENREVWRQRALDLGSLLSLSSKASELSRSDPEAAFKIYTQLWEAGQVRSVSKIAQAYRSGTAPGLNGKPDLMKAYAFELLQNKTFTRALDVSENPNASNIQTMMHNSLSIDSASLTLDELNAAEVLAIELLRRNKDCCKGIWHAF